MPNRLAAESSPYLRQHADNPVDWWPWSDEALARARAENKPILLSIGYAACHWCHVMAHESFEDPATARVMNERFVNIKVDREERPDLDKIYQLAHQALARRGGGWPLTVALTPDDLMPFFAGTYFPKSPRHGMPSFVQVLNAVRDWYDRKPDEVRAQNASLAAFLDEQSLSRTHEGALDDAPLAAALERIRAGFDAEHGGHVGAPKFPHAAEIELLLSRRPVFAHDMALLTLSKMAEGGLRDHLGGGFFRYCVDERWEIPHFEKMLYDNAQLLPLYARAAQSAGDAGLGEAANEAARWIVAGMSAPDGGFFSSLDADSGGEEGAYYVWTRDEVRAHLDAAEFAVVERHFGLDRAPNFEGEAWHLREVEPWTATAEHLGIGEATARERWASARARLLDVRSRRVRPALDDKILTAWNALMIGGAARAARSGDGFDALLAAAERALDFLHANSWREGRLYASHARGETKFAAYLDDHAFLLDALLAMLALRWKRRDLDWAIALADALIYRFEDRDGGGFFFTSDDAEPLPQRPKPFVDESLPSGNGAAARALIRLGHLVGDARYLEAAERTLRASWPMLVDYPQACATLLLALDEFLAPRAHLAVRFHDDATRWKEAVAGDATDIDAYFIPAGEPGLPGVLGGQSATATTAFLCEGIACLPPITDPQTLANALRDRRH